MSNIKTLLSNTKISLLIMFGLHFVLLMLALRYKADSRKILVSLSFFLAALASVLVFIFAIYFPARSACPATIFTCMGSLLLVSGICEKCKVPLKSISAVLTALALAALILGSGDIYSSYVQDNARQEFIAEKKAEGESRITVDRITASSKYTAVWPYESANFNTDMALYYGFDEFWIYGAEYTAY